MIRFARNAAFATVSLFAAALVTGTSASVADGTDSQALVLTQRIGPAHGLRVVVSSLGASTTEYRDGRPVASAIVNYAAHTIYAADYDARSYTAEPISKAVDGVLRERSLVHNARTEITFDTASGGPESSRPVFQKTSRRSTIAGMPAQAYLARENGLLERLWVGLKVPMPPADIRLQARDAVDAPLQAGAVVLRAEVLSGQRWSIALDTTDAHLTTRDSESFAPPAGWKHVRLQSRSLATVPASVSRLVGPVSSRPDVFTLYWSGAFPPSFKVSMNTFLASLIGGPAPSPFWTPLAQYGVLRGSFIGSATTGFPLPTSVGSVNVPAINAMVTIAMLTTAAPKIWWRFGDRDPILVIFVPANLVDVGAWVGYHLFSPAATWLLPWPVSLAAYPVLPWLIVKAPISGGAPSVSGTTLNTSHELVEAASDPMPLSANIDPSKTPQWTSAEIADICSIGLPPSTLMEFSFPVQAYWSNAAHACVG